MDSSAKCRYILIVFIHRLASCVEADPYCLGRIGEGVSDKLTTLGRKGRPTHSNTIATRFTPSASRRSAICSSFNDSVRHITAQNRAN